MYDEQTLQQKVNEARARGVDEATIQARVSELRSQNQITTPVTNPESLIRTKSTGEKVGTGIINFAGNLVKSAVKPFVETAKNIGSAVIQAPSMLAQGKLIEAISNPKTPEWMRTIAQKELDAMEKYTPNFRTEAELSNPEKLVRQQVGNSAQVASWAVPFSKEAGFIKGAVLPGAVMGGASAGGRTLAQEKTTLPEILGNTVIGAGTGALTAGALYGAGKLINKTGEKLKTSSEAITAKNLNLTPAQTAKFYKQTGQTLPEFIKEQGLQGADMNELEEVIASKQDLFDSVASNPNLKVSGKEIINTLKSTAKELSASTIPADVTKAKTLEIIADKFKVKYGNGDLSADVVTQLRQQVDNVVKDFGVDAGVRTPLNVYRTILQDTIRNSADQQGLLAGDATLKMAGQELSKFYRLSDLATTRQFINQGAVLKIGGKDAISAIVGSLFGGPVGAVTGVVANRALQSPAGNKVISGVAGTAGNILSAKLPPILEQGIPKAAVALTTSGIGGNPPKSLPTINQPTGGLNATGNIPGQLPSIKATYLTGHSPEEIYQAMQKAQNAGDTRAEADLRQMYNDENAYQKSNPNASGAVLNPNARDAEGLLSTVENQLISSDGTINKGLIYESAISPLGHKYEADLNSLMIKFIQSQTTSGRLPTPEQLKIYKKAYAPNALDSDEAIRAKLLNLRDAIENAKYTKPTADILPTDTGY